MSLSEKLRSCADAEISDQSEPERAGQRTGERPSRSLAPVQTTAHEIDRDRISDHYAAQLRETACAAFLYSSMAGVFQQVDTNAFKTFRDRLLADAGNPSDPIEVMIVEQVALAHMNVGRLQFKSATSDSLEASKVYGDLATRLMGEFRRSCLALQAYRLSARQLSFTTGEAKHIPGVATGGPAGETSQGAEKDPSDSKLVSNEKTDDGEEIVPFRPEEPKTCCGRPSERSEAPGSIARRA
jgi:hypothetical protein